MKLDLAGHTMTCTGSGFAGSCQVPAFTSHGVYVPPDRHLRGLVVTGPGTIPESGAVPISVCNPGE